MQIARIDTWLTSPCLSDDGWTEVESFLFVRLTSDDGYEGWGEAFTLPYRDAGVAAIIHALGREAMAIEDLTPAVFRSFGDLSSHKHRGIDYATATSALEMAIWDLDAQRRGLPLHRLLGESVREEVPVYANIWSDRYKEDKVLADRAAMFLAKGYRAIKMYPLQFRTVEQAAACVAEVRARVVAAVDLMLDLECPDDPEIPLSLAPLVEPYSPYWYEEPADGDDLTALAAIRARTDLPVVTGERQTGLLHFRDVIRLRAADILNPDIASVGGILEMLQIAEEAEKVGITVSPHCWNSTTIAVAAMLHVCRVMPNAGYAEIATGYDSAGRRFVDPGYVISGGTARLADAPGLGVTVDTDRLSSLASRQTTERDG
ncbi:MAG: mandelate racemase/muconate lactonizing enzyme family protein [Deltaproteobacteria bacterium]|jgi:galactonate dehydratase|nr:mandelate racemase/muconate lactonizing enzyme family protein [Deltaproteobacteria bacterium]